MNFTEKKISVQAILALKEALISIFWTKKDLRQFIELTIENSLIVSTIDWTENTKTESISELIDRMTKREDIYQKDLLKLIQEATNFDDFSHLDKWDDSKEKITRAKAAVQKLRSQTKGYFEIIDDLKKSEKAREANKAKITNSLFSQQRLNELKENFFKIAVDFDYQSRGSQLLQFLNQLFIFFDLDPKSSFAITHGQLNGSFTFDNTDYLLEAKWEKKVVTLSDLLSFGGKIQSTLKNTLGLYISMEGFSPECIKTADSTVKAIILMDGVDLMQVLEGRVKLNDMLYIKRRHASGTGEIFYRITDL